MLDEKYSGLLYFDLYRELGLEDKLGVNFEKKTDSYLKQILMPYFSDITRTIDEKVIACMWFISNIFLLFGMTVTYVSAEAPNELNHDCGFVSGFSSCMAVYMIAVYLFVCISSVITNFSFKHSCNCCNRCNCCNCKCCKCCNHDNCSEYAHLTRYWYIVRCGVATIYATSVSVQVSMILFCFIVICLS